MRKLWASGKIFLNTSSEQAEGRGHLVDARQLRKERSQQLSLRTRDFYSFGYRRVASRFDKGDGTVGLVPTLENDELSPSTLFGCHYFGLRTYE